MKATAHAPVAEQLLMAARAMNRRLNKLRFGPPVEYVYNPLEYVWDGYAQYVKRYAHDGCSVLFLGMNPGPWGMCQTGVPFGEVAVVRDWLGIDPVFRQPRRAHPKRPIAGCKCRRSEVSGARLWGLFRAHYQSPRRFFRQAFIANYCPLAFLETTARNRTPDRLPPDQRRALFAICDEHLVACLETLQPKHIVGIGKFASDRAVAALADQYPVSSILHPSPASPASNRDWSGTVTRQLQVAKIW